MALSWQVEAMIPMTADIINDVYVMAVMFL